jgi:hypothetical protein
MAAISCCSLAMMSSADSEKFLFGDPVGVQAKPEALYAAL